MKFLFYSVWVSASGWFFGCCFCGCCFSPILFPYFSWRKSMVGEGVLCTWLLWRYHSWFYNPLNYYSTCSWNDTEISPSPEGISWGHGYHTHGVAQARAWKRALKSWLLLCPQSGKFLFSWCQQLPGGSQIGGSCLFWGVVCLFLHRVRVFFCFDLFATICFQGQLIVENNIFSPIKYDTQQHSCSHTGAFIHPREKSTFKYEVGSSWCPVLLPLKSTGDLPAT